MPFCQICGEPADKAYCKDCMQDPRIANMTRKKKSKKKKPPQRGLRGPGVYNPDERHG